MISDPNKLTLIIYITSPTRAVKMQSQITRSFFIQAAKLRMIRTAVCCKWALSSGLSYLVKLKTRMFIIL